MPNPGKGTPRLCSEPVLRMCPPPLFWKRGTNTAQPFSTPKTLTAKVHSASAPRTSVSGPATPTPALLHRLSPRPNSAHARSARASTEARSVTSHFTPMLCAPDARNSAATCSARDASMSATTTCAPSATSARAIPRPMPLAPPVTTPTLSRSLMRLPPSHSKPRGPPPRRRWHCYNVSMLDSGWIDRYWENGFAVIRGLFPRWMMSELGRYFDEVFASAAGMAQVTKRGLAEFRVLPIAGVPTLKFVKWAASFHAGLDRFRTSPELLPVAFALLGPDLRQITNQMHWKNPGDDVSFQMHQDCTFRKPDAAYRNLFRSFIQTAIAVDACAEANGCIQFVPQSHRAATALVPGGYEGWEGNAANRAVLDRFPPAVPALLDPGDVV